MLCYYSKKLEHVAVDNKNFCVYNYRAKVFVDFFAMLCYYVASLNIIACEGGIDMQEARMLGNYVEHLAQRKGLSISDLSRILDCTENQVYSFIKGRAYASFAQISTLATELGATIEELLHGDERTYNATVVHCMNDFQDNKNRETILDLIDDYVDIVDAVLTQ